MPKVLANGKPTTRRYSVEEKAAAVRMMRTTISVTATLALDSTQSDADALCRYVESKGWRGEKIRSQVFIYAPPGVCLVDGTVDGLEVEPFRQANVDLGRVDAVFAMFLEPGEVAAVSVTFSGSIVTTPLTLRVSPMIRGAVTEISDCHRARARVRLGR